jgi:hypothetical protein
MFYRARSPALLPIPNLEAQVYVFMSPDDRVAQLYPQAPGSLFVTFYDSQGYGGGILTRLQAGNYYDFHFKIIHNIRENTIVKKLLYSSF